LDNINDITLGTGALMGIVCVDSLKETFNVGVAKQCAKNILSHVQEALDAFRNAQASVSSPSSVSGADEILKYKSLLDSGIITQEEFEAKKKQLLGL
jgi:hypothetical protein